MSVQTNQYLLYGVMLPYEWHKEWEKEHGKDFYETFEPYMDDSAFDEGVNHKDGVFCIFDGMNSRFIAIGRVIDKSKDGELIAEESPIALPEFSDLEEELLSSSITRVFGITNHVMAFYFITLFR